MSNYYSPDRYRHAAPAPPPTSNGHRSSMPPPPHPHSQSIELPWFLLIPSNFPLSPGRPQTVAPTSAWAPPPSNGYRSPPTNSPDSMSPPPLPSINTTWSSAPEHHARQRSQSRASYRSPPAENILSPIQSHDKQSLLDQIAKLQLQLSQQEVDKSEIVRQRDAFREQLGFVMVELQGTKRKLDEAYAEMDLVKSKRDKYQKQRNQYKELLVKRERDDKLRDLGHGPEHWGRGPHG